MSSKDPCTSVKWFANFLTQHQMRVVIDGQLSSEASMDSGVPQGAVLGPLLFLCHINNLPSAVRSQVHLFLDDCLLYREIHSCQDYIVLQQDLYSSWRYGQDSGGWSSTLGNAISWVYAASHPTYTPWKITSCRNVGSSNGRQPSTRSWRATSQPCRQKTSWHQQTEVEEEYARPPLRTAVTTTPSQTRNSKLLWLEDSRQQEWAV